MTFRQCNMMYLIEVNEKVKIHCSKKNKKQSLNKCMKCIKKSEGI